MNIFEAQERLNRLPPSPQTLQYLSAAAEGQNPNVPPWLALVRMNEIKQEMQTAQKMGQEQQGPQGPPPTVKDQTQQAMGIMALQQQKQQAGIQQLAQQAGAQAQPIPAGGIAGVAPPQAFRGGGIVMGFQAGGYVPPGEEDPELERRREEERLRAERAGVVPDYLRPILAESERARDAARQQRDSQYNTLRELARQDIPTAPDPNIAYRQQYAEMGVDPKAAYAEQQRRMQALEARMAQDEATRRQEQEQAGRGGFWNSLIAAGEATRGARGSGIAQALGGYGRAQTASDAALAQQRRESDAKMMQRQAELDKLYAGIDEGRMGTAEGFAKRQTGYEGTQAAAKGTRQKNIFDTEALIGRGVQQEALEAGKSFGDILERGASARGETDKMAASERNERIRALSTLSTSLNASTNSLRSTVEELSKRPGALKGLPPHAGPYQKALKDLQDAEDKQNKVRDALAALTMGGAGGGYTPPPSGGGGGTAQSGALPPPNTAAAKFRQTFPPTR